MDIFSTFRLTSCALLLCAVTVQSESRPPVYVWTGKAIPELANSESITVVIAEAASHDAAIQMLAVAARKARCNGVLRVKTAKIGKANTSRVHWEATGELVTFRDPKTLNRRLTKIMR